VENGRLTRFDEAEIVSMVDQVTTGWTRPG
jgi:hypothetical protein